MADDEKNKKPLPDYLKSNNPQRPNYPSPPQPKVATFEEFNRGLMPKPASPQSAANKGGGMYEPWNEAHNDDPYKGL